MTTRTVDKLTLEIVQGDIADQPDVDAIVNAANAELQTGGGVAGAIHRAAGPGLAEEGRGLAPIEPGQAVMTPAYELPNRHVIHCLGPVWGRDEPSDDLLASCYRQALALADRHGLQSIAFPAISTGAFGFPAERAVTIALESVIAAAENLHHLRLVRFVLFSNSDCRIYEDALLALDD